MSAFSKFILSTTAVAAITISSIAHAQTSSPYANQLYYYNDAQVLRILVNDYKRDKSTFEDAYEYLSLNRRDLLDEYLEKTRGGYASRNYRGGGVSPLALGAALGGAAGVAYLLSQGEKDSDNGPTPDPDPIFNFTPISGNTASFQTSEYNANYGLERIGAASRYASGAQGQGVKISVLDTGIDVDHVDFAGKIDLANSYSYIGSSNDISDTGGHGTHVAGIAAALKNDYGTHGVAFGSELVIYKGIPGNDSESPNQNNVWADAINRSVAAGADVMNNSWNYVRPVGNDTESVPITDFVDRNALRSYLGSSTIDALNNAVSNDMLSVVAAGNDGASQVAVNAGVPLLMSEYQGYFIAAVALNSNNTIANYSNRCGQAMNFCLAAPGTGILSAGNGGGTAYSSGTSMAAPHISGAYALLKSQSPELTAPEISQILFDTATDLGAPGVDSTFGHGLVNVSEATQPQGNLMVYQSDSTLGAKTALSTTGITASSALSGAMASALKGQELMVGDRYDRGFYLDADAMLSTSSAALPSIASVQETQLGAGISLLSSASGTGLRIDGESFSYTMSQGALEQNTLSPLSMVASEMAASYEINLSSDISLLADLSGATNGSNNMASSIGFNVGEKGGTGFAAKIGMLNEDGSVLGSQFYGAAGQSASAKTSFLEMSSRIGLAGDSFIDLVGTRSETNFSQSGLVTGGSNLAGTAGKIAFGKKNAFGFGGTIVASVSSPLQVTSGTINVDMPSSRQASEGGAVSTGVNRQSQSVDVSGGSRPYDLSLSYLSDADKDGMGIMVNAGARTQGSEMSPFFGLSLSAKF